MILLTKKGIRARRAHDYSKNFKVIAITTIKYKIQSTLCSESDII